MNNTPHLVRVWDTPVRLFHWLAAALVLAAYVTWRLRWMDWHARVGEVLLALLLFRLAWGFVGSETARFSRFLSSPATAVKHLKYAFVREPDLQIGHNPAGGWMVLLLLLLLIAETTTGLYVANDIADVGPLTELVPAQIANAIDASHTILWKALLAAIAFHLLAIVGYAFIKGQDLVRPMITGTKILPSDLPAPRIASPLRALMLLGGCVGAAAALADFL
jgi:cytochrome b